MNFSAVTLAMARPSTSCGTSSRRFTLTQPAPMSRCAPASHHSLAKHSFSAGSVQMQNRWIHTWCFCEATDTKGTGCFGSQ